MQLKLLAVLAAMTLVIGAVNTASASDPAGALSGVCAGTPAATAKQLKKMGSPKRYFDSLSVSKGQARLTFVHKDAYFPDLVLHTHLSGDTIWVEEWGKKMTRTMGWVWVDIRLMGLCPGKTYRLEAVRKYMGRTDLKHAWSFTMPARDTVIMNSFTPPDESRIMEQIEKNQDR